jgi:hypothetical protein
MKSEEEKETKKQRKLQKLQTRKLMLIPSGADGVKRVSALGHTRLDCCLIPVLIPVLISVSELIYTRSTLISLPTLFLKKKKHLIISLQKNFIYYLLFSFRKK